MNCKVLHKWKCLLFVEAWACQTIWSSPALFVYSWLILTSSLLLLFEAHRGGGGGLATKWTATASFKQLLSHLIFLPSPYSCVFLITRHKGSSTFQPHIRILRAPGPQISEKTTLFFCRILHGRRLHFLQGQISLSAQKMEPLVCFFLLLFYFVLFLKCLSWSAKCFCGNIPLVVFIFIVSYQINFPDKGGFLPASMMSMADAWNRARLFPLV